MSKEEEEAGKYWLRNEALVQGQIIGDHATVIYQQGAAQLPPEQIWSVPFGRNGFFLGQEKLLAQLHQNLRRGTATAVTQIQAVSGLGGIGKTQLALEYAYRYREVYPFVFWIRAEHRETLLADFVNLAELLRLPRQSETEPMKAVRAVLQWLATHPGWLMIFDNVDDLSLLSTFVPTYHPGAVLLTTRQAQTEPVATPLSVEPLDEQAGAELLLHRARLLAPGQRLVEASVPDQQAACQLSRLMGGLPLALDQAGAYIDEVQCQVQDYLRFYAQDQPRTRLLQRRGRIGANHPEAVATTWSLAFIRVEQRSQAAADLLRACAFLDPDDIPEDLIRQQATHWSEALARVVDDDFEWNETLGELLSYALVKRSRDQRALSLHRLVQTVLKDALDGATARQWAEHTVLAVEQAFPDSTNATNWATCKRLLSHARYCAELIAHEGIVSWEAANLLLNLANYLRELSWYREAEPLYERALQLWEKLEGPEGSEVAYPLNGLALLYYEQGQYARAEPFYQRALHIWESKEDLNLAYPLYNLASLYYEQGRYAEAEPLYRRALAMREKRFGPDHSEVAYPLNGLAILYHEQGKYAEAEPLYQRALLIWEQQLSPDHPQVAHPLDGLAILYYTQKKYAEAESLYRRALEIREKHLDPEHPQVASPLYGLANLYHAQGKYAEAEPLYQRALRIRERHMGPNHPRTKEVRKNYARLLRAMKRGAEADRLEGKS